MRLFSRVGDSLGKIAFHMSETDEVRGRGSGRLCAGSEGGCVPGQRAAVCSCVVSEGGCMLVGHCLFVVEFFFLLLRVCSLLLDHISAL